MNKKTNKEHSKKKQFILFGLCSFLALCLCMATLVITVRRLDGENGENNNTEQTQSKTTLNGETETLVEYIYGLTEKANNNKFVKINSYRDISVDDSEIKVTDYDGNENEKDRAILAYVKNQMIGTIDELYGDDYVGVFGTVCNKMPLINLWNCNGVKSSFSTGLTNEDNEPVLDNDGNPVDEDYYYITLETDGTHISEKSAKETFRLNVLPDIAAGVKEKIAPVCMVSDSTVSAENFLVRAKVNRLTDEISYIEIERIYNISADVVFKNELSVFGNKKVDFKYKVTEKFEYFYAGITLNENQLTVGVGDETSLTVNAVIENDSEYKVYFESSDESVATVDEMGYIKGIKNSDEPVIITVTLEYLGEKFTDECKVYVNEQAEN